MKVRGVSAEHAQQSRGHVLRSATHLRGHDLIQDKAGQWSVGPVPCHPRSVSTSHGLTLQKAPEEGRMSCPRAAPWGSDSSAGAGHKP